MLGRYLNTQYSQVIVITERTLKGKEYHSLLRKYCGLTNEIRRLEESFASQDVILEVDKRRSFLHRELELIGEFLGKTKEDTTRDMLLTEGNLREYDIDAPLIKLPLVTRYFGYNESACGIELNLGKSKLAKQWISKPNEKGHIAGYERYFTKKDGNYTSFDKIKITGKKEEITKWRRQSFFAIIFSNWERSWDVEYAPILHKRRLERRLNLARDFSLNFYEADNLLGHRDNTSLFLYGIEVSNKRLEEIVNAMRTHPEKYWLTDDELNNPYKYEYLSYESLGVLDGHLYSEICKAEKKGVWINFLKIALVITKKIKERIGEKRSGSYEEYIKDQIRKCLTLNLSDNKTNIEHIREAIEKARSEGRTKLAERLETDLSSLIEELT